MSKRPISITIIGWLFIVTGVVGLSYHLTEFTAQNPFDPYLILVCFVGLLAIPGGVYVMRGFNWARWLLFVWIGIHVVISIHHPLSELVVHCVLFVVIAYFLFCPRASAYFRAARTKPPPGGTNA